MSYLDDLEKRLRDTDYIMIQARGDDDVADQAVEEMEALCFEAAEALASLRRQSASFVEFVMRHTWPERATAHGADAVHRIIKHHPFPQEHGPRQAD